MRLASCYHRTGTRVKYTTGTDQSRSNIPESCVILTLMLYQKKFSAGTKSFDLQANVFQMSRSVTTLAVQLISKLFVAHVDQKVNTT